MVFLGPAPMLLIGQLVIFSNRARPGLGWSATPPSMPSSSSPARCWPEPARDHLGIATTSAWFSLVVVALFVATWGLNLILHAVYVRVLAGVRIERQIADA